MPRRNLTIAEALTIATRTSALLPDALTPVVARETGVKSLQLLIEFRPTPKHVTVPGVVTESCFVSYRNRTEDEFDERCCDAWQQLADAIRVHMRPAKRKRAM